MRIRTIFRVVGGFSNRKTLIEYEIVPYLCMKETRRNYYTSKDGRFELQQKRTTSNSQWFEDIDSALDCIVQRIDNARQSIHNSLEQIIDTNVPHRFSRMVYAVVFHEETFVFYEYEYDGTTRPYRGQISGALRVTEKTFSGKKYLYPTGGKPHNPESPNERWISQDLDTMLSLVRKYAEDRLRYLHKAKQKSIDWVKVFKQKREQADSAWEQSDET